jgi:2-methylcitrate dehydratase PrpD
MNPAESIARHVLETPFASIPEAARRAGKIFILDTIGVGVAGAKAPLAANILAAARRWGGPPVRGAAHAFGGGASLPASSAAFVNGFLIHCQEFDCVHEPAVVHPMATIFAALSAETECAGASGEALLAAVILAVDVAAGLGVAAKAPIKFFRPATAGVFGATLGVARLRGFDINMALDALGHALAHASGTMQAHVEGKPGLPVQIGNAARAAILACDLAQAGVSAAHDAVTGPFGYLTLFEGDFDLAPAIESLGRIFRIEEVSHKPFPTGRAAQGGIVAVQNLRDQGVRADNLENLVLTAPPLIKRLVGRPYRDEMSTAYARLCYAYSGAVALTQGAVGLEDFSPERLARPDIKELARKITINDDGSKDPAAFTPQIARATLVSGAVVEARIDALLGSPAEPLSRERHLAKFRDCMAFGLGADAGARAGAALIARVDTIEQERDAAELIRLASGSER